MARTVLCWLLALSLLVSLPRVYGIMNYANEGDACSRGDHTWYAVPDSPHHFLYCHAKHGVYVRDECAMFGVTRKTFNQDRQQCMSKSSSPSRSVFFGGLRDVTNNWSTCTTTSQCPPMAECRKLTRNMSRGKCVCREGRVKVMAKCMTIISLGGYNCSSSVQCAASWPGAVCLSAMCQCPSATVMVTTLDGLKTCAPLNQCSLGGANVMLADGMSCHKKGGCSSNGRDLAHLYDCVKPRGFHTAICCPNKASTCMAPPMSGNGPFKQMRYHFDPLTNQCKSFVYRGGLLVNSNVFQTESQCRLYCAKSCPRGKPEMTKGGVKECKENADCGKKHKCLKEEGVCCPTIEHICSSAGGVEFSSQRSTEYDDGFTSESPSAVLYPVIRYYYSLGEMSCKAFLYKGEGGNFNRFLSMEECHRTCTPLKCDSVGELAVNDTTLHSIPCRGSSIVNECGEGHVCKYGVCCKLAVKVTPLPYKNARGPAPSVRSKLRLKKKEVCRGTLLSPMSGGDGASIECYLGEEWPCLHSNHHVCTFANVNTTKGICCPRPTITQYRCPVGMSPRLEPSTSRTTGQSLRRLTYHDDVYQPVHRTSTLSRSSSKAKSGRYVQQCSPLHLRTCAGDDGFCVFDEMFGTYHCCETDVDIGGNGCVDGQRAFADPITNKTLECSPTQSNTCPPGFGCRKSTSRNIFQCCGVAATCPRNSAALPSSSGGTVACSTVGACPRGYICHKRVCCSEDPVIQLCDHGTALSTADGHAVQCKTDKSTCGDGYSCVKRFNIHVCCPTPRHICTQSITLLPSSKCLSGQSTTTLYHYDAVGRQCRPFDSNGCLPFDNHFTTMRRCKDMCAKQAMCAHGSAQTDRNGQVAQCSTNERCTIGYECVRTTNGNHCCPTAAMFCTLPPSKGSRCAHVGHGTEERQAWHFDTATATCKQFVFLGCDAALNMFNTEQNCMASCARSVCPHGTPQLGYSDGAVVTCESSAQCGVGHACQPMANVMNSAMNVCCPSVQTVCAKPPVKGTPCNQTPMYRFAYASSKGVCERLLHFGCGDTKGSFGDMETCERLCITQAEEMSTPLCPVGRSPYTTSNNSSAVSCSPIFDNCPKDYSCAQRNTNAYYCCSNTVRCLSGLSPQTSASSEGAKQCFPGPYGYYDGCDGGHSCQMATNGDYYCCPIADRHSACAHDAYPFVHATTDRPMLCSPEFGNCPMGYRCLFNKGYGQHYCCTMPPNLTANLLPTTRHPRIQDLTTTSTTTTTTTTTTVRPMTAATARTTSTRRTRTTTRRPRIRATTRRAHRWITTTSRPMTTTPTRATPMTTQATTVTINRAIATTNNTHLYTITAQALTTNAGKPLQIHRDMLCADGTLPHIDPEERTVRICNPFLSYTCPTSYICDYNMHIARYQCCKKVESVAAPPIPEQEACPVGLRPFLHPRTQQPIVCQPGATGFCPYASMCQYSSLYWQFICCRHDKDPIAQQHNDFKSPSSPSATRSMVRSAFRRRVIYPGETGCVSDLQCSRAYVGAACHDWICRCPPHMFVYRRSCYSRCPSATVPRGWRCVPQA